MKSISLTLKNLITERLHLTFYALGFLIPLVVSGPQWITGILINGLLFVASTRFPKKTVLPLVVIPSIASILNGILFGPQTVFLYYFLPFIWLGNYVLISVFTGMGSKPFMLKVSVSAVAKTILLFCFAYLYVQLRIVPQLFIASMGMIQLVTAIGGGLFAYIITKKL